MQVSKGGQAFGFCPGKATWDHAAAGIFKLLIVSAESGQPVSSDALADMPVDTVDLLYSFYSSYNELKFNRRASAVLGGVSGGSKR